ARLEIVERHLDARLGLEPLRGLAIHPGDRLVQVERIGSNQVSPQPQYGVADVAGGHRGVPWRGIDVSPALEAFVRRHAYQHAPLHLRDPVNAPHWRLQGHVDHDRLDLDDSHTATLPETRLPLALRRDDAGSPRSSSSPDRAPRAG